MALSVAEVIEIALLPLFCMVGVATCVISSVATSELGKVVWVAIALMVVGEVTENGVLLYGVLEAVGLLPSVV